MADDDDFEQQGFQPRNRAAEIAETVAAAAAALASGALLRAQEIISLADDLGNFQTNVDSSFIESIGYNLATNSVTANFRDGSQWTWPNIPIGEFLRWLNASSKGQFFNSEVRGRWAPLSHLSEGTKGRRK
jgi:hypothetical protein